MQLMQIWPQQGIIQRITSDIKRRDSLAEKFTGNIS